jgi:hypothetical protein
MFLNFKKKKLKFNFSMSKKILKKINQDIKYYFSLIDFFAAGVELTIKGNKRSPTVLGGVLTLFTLSTLIIIFVIYMKNITYHLNPELNVHEKYSTYSHDLIINEYTFPIGWTLTGNDNIGIDKSSYFKYKVIFFHGTTNNILQETELEYEVCNSSKHFPLISNQYNDGGFTHVYCLKNNNITLSGSWNEEYISYISIRMKYCNKYDGTFYKNDKSNCASNEEVNDYLEKNELFLNILYMDSVFHPFNYKNPIQNVLGSAYTSISIGISKIYEIYLQPNYLITDDGLVFSNNESKKVITTNFYVNDFTQYNNYRNDSFIGEIGIYTGKKYSETKRIYSKIHTILANVGGVANFLIIFFRLFCYPFSIIKRDEAILNEIFEFDFDRNKQTGGLITDKRRSSIVKIKNLFASSGLIKMKKPQKYNQRNNIFSTKKKFRIELKNNDSKENLNNNNIENKIEPIVISTDKDSSRITSSTISNKNIIKTSGSNDGNLIIENALKYYNSDILSDEEIEEPNNISSWTEPDVKINYSEIIEKIEKDKKFEKEKIRRKKLAKKQKKSLNELFNLLDTKKDHNELHFRLFEVILLIFNKFCVCFRNSKFKDKLLLYRRSNYTIQDYIDLTFIIKKLEEFDKLKYILLTNEQLAMFNFIGKDVCSINKNYQNNSAIHIMKSLTRDKYNLLSNIIVKYQQRIKYKDQEEGKLNEMEEKLFSMIRPEIKEICI